MDRGKSLRKSHKKKSSTPPATFPRRLEVDTADVHRRRPKASLSPKPEGDKNRSHPRHQAHKDWVTEWEHQTSPITVEGSSHESSMKKHRRPNPTGLSRSLGGLLRVRPQSGWTSQTWQSQSEEDLLPEAQKPLRKQESRIDVAAEVLSLRNELQKLHAENVTQREGIIMELQDLMKQREDLYRNRQHVQESNNSTGDGNSSNLSQERIQAEMERIENERAFKTQVADILRTMLLKIKGQRSKVKSVSQSEALLTKQLRQSSIHDSSKSVMEGRSEDMQMSKEVSALESEIANVEDHLKLLNDAIDDEKQENYELAKENHYLREQVQSTGQKA